MTDPMVRVAEYHGDESGGHLLFDAATWERLKDAFRPPEMRYFFETLDIVGLHQGTPAFVDQCPCEQALTGASVEEADRG